MKMFLTQTNGLFSRIYEQEQFSIEDCARLLAQAAVGEGNIYIKGFNEMESVTIEALNGAEPFLNAQLLTDINAVTDADRVLIITRFSNDKEAIDLAEKLVASHIPFAAISGKLKSETNDLQNLADVHIHTSLLKPMLPTETGDRVCFPSSMTALFIYHCIKLAFDDIMEEY